MNKKELAYAIEVWIEYKLYEDCDLIELIQLFEHLKTTSANKEPSLDYIKQVVCEYFNIPVDYLDLKTNKRDFVEPRQAAHFIARKMTTNSLSIIGQKIGNKDHATILHSCKTISNLMETDKQFRHKIELIENRLK
jgi:chromosomal replication initiator protein